ncbi:uncharacterized protein TNCT_690071 [Trichonephila clavata]|uniref:Uncharacterized protein n=1 Tax=Trichonephila clavata TaxID=2740835 RepID=A0A8X6LWA6_TRICU|nr:uncharacterized protein TNCT_690071 [Trichonephila clavata]
MGWSRKKKDRLQYPCIPSAIQPVPHSSDMPIPDPPKQYDFVKDYVERETELQASRLQQWNLLLPGVKITEYSTREKNLLHFLEKKGHVVACIDVNGLMNFMNLSCGPNNWRLFIDSSKLSLKAVLLHNGNLLPSIPIGHSVLVKETYANVYKTSRVNKILG